MEPKLRYFNFSIFFILSRVPNKLRVIGGDSGIVECLGKEFFKHPHLTYTIKARKNVISDFIA